jgi:hypothetical protein
MEPVSRDGDVAKSPLVAEMDRVIAGIAGMDRQSAFAALESVFDALKVRCDTLSEAEVCEFVEFVHLVLLQFARNLTIRVSGPRQQRGLDVCLKYNDVYEAALNRALDFLVRNLYDHLEKYSAQQYLRAALRVLGKEYYHVLTDSYHTVSIPDESAAREDESSSAASAGYEESSSRNPGALADEALTVVGPEEGDSPAHRRERAAGQRAELEMFLNWYEGNLSRLELTRLYGMTLDQVDQTLLRVAHTFEGGTHYAMVKWLIEMGEDGDIVWLLSKDMTAADVGQKVHRNQWVVYKHRDAVRRRLKALQVAGDDGRAFFAWLLGLQSDPARVGPVRRDRAASVGAQELGAEARSG